jgi:hypothetical protein
VGTAISVALRESVAAVFGPLGGVTVGYRVSSKNSSNQHQSFPGNRFAVYLTKLRYDARASISFGDNLPAIRGIGGSASA